MNYFREMHKIKLFIKDLSSYHSKNVFNPWGDFDPDYDISASRTIRRNQLSQYLIQRLESARILVIAEACGYQGGHFTGIAMNCERMILNFHPTITSKMILGKKGKRTSRQNSPFIPKEIQREKGFNEPTDTIVWNSILNCGLSPTDFILWNIFPFHPYKKNKMLSNRTPSDKELEIGLEYTRKLLKLTGPLPIYAVGKKSEHTLQNAGFKVTGLRHPANGGATLFREGLKDSLIQKGLYSK